MLTEAFLSLLARLLPLLPSKLVKLLGILLGWVWYYLIPIRKKEVLASLQERLGVDEKIARRHARRMFENLGRNVVEFFLLDGQGGNSPQLKVERINFERFRRAYAKGKGVIVVTAHFGNWDLLASSQAASGVPITIVSKTIRPRALNRFWMKGRSAAGVEILPTAGVYDVLKERLHAGGVLGFVIDQHVPPPKGVAVDFLGKQAYTTSAPARLAIETSAPILPIYLFRKETTGHEMVVGEEIPVVVEDGRARDVEEILVDCNRSLEQAIQREPAHWLWLHRRWKSQEKTG